ncbi:MAG: hypothetical protein WAO52_08835 [Prolixibacteraceae bacterium]
MLLLLSNASFSQDKIGFTIQKVSMMGFDAKAIGTVTFNKSFTEMEIKQYIIPVYSKTPKAPKFETKRYKLDGTRLDGKGIKEFENLDIVFCGTALSDKEPNFFISTFLDKDSCSLVIPEFGYEASGKLMPN